MSLQFWAHPNSVQSTLLYIELRLESGYVWAFFLHFRLSAWADLSPPIPTRFAAFIIYKPKPLLTSLPNYNLLYRKGNCYEI